MPIYNEGNGVDFDDHEEHTCPECGEQCNCAYDPCICCNYDW